MGNCIVVQEKVIKVIKPDGKILEYKAPIKAQQVLSDFSGHAISNSVQDLQHLLPDSKLQGGNLYYLIPLPLPPPVIKKKKVRFAIPEEENKVETRQESKKGTVVRIKLVISKQELQEILSKGVVSVDDMVSHLHDQQRVKSVDNSDDNDNYKAWKPVLDGIPELA